MSLPSINYKQAAQVGAIAIAIGVVPPVGLTAVIGTLALSAIGISLIEAADTITAQDTTHKKSYQVVKRSFRNKSEKDKAQAIRRLEHFNSYRMFQADAKDEEKDSIVSLKVSGTCHAQVALLFKQMLETEQLSIEESAKSMQTVDVCYMRGIQTLHRFTRKRLRTIERDMEQIEQGDRLYLYVLLLLKAGYKEELERLKKLDPLYSCSERKERFYSELSRKDYSRYFKKAVRAASIPKNEIIRGTVKIPGHALGFQVDATKKEYYIYNSTRKGLYKYDREKKFFKKLRGQIVKHIGRKEKRREVYFRVLPSRTVVTQ